MNFTLPPEFAPRVRIAEQGGPKHLESNQIVALVAYLQRLGTDIKKQGSGS